MYAIKNIILRHSFEEGINLGCVSFNNQKGFIKF